MDHKLFVENYSSAAVNKLLNSIILFEGCKVFEYQTETDLLELKTKVQKTEYEMLYYGCEDSGLLCLKLKTLQ